MADLLKHKCTTICRYCKTPLDFTPHLLFRSHVGGPGSRFAACMTKHFPDHFGEKVKSDDGTYMIMVPKCAALETRKRAADVDFPQDEKTAETLERWSSVLKDHPITEARLLPNMPVPVRDGYRIRNVNDIGSCFLLGDRIFTAAHCVPSPDEPVYVCTPRGNHLLWTEGAHIDRELDLAWFKAFEVLPNGKKRALNDPAGAGLVALQWSTLTKPADGKMFCWFDMPEMRQHNDTYDSMGRPPAQQG